MWVTIYRNHLWGLFKTELDEIEIHSREAASVLLTAKAKKAAEEAEERKAQEEKERHAILSFLNTKP